MIGFEIACVDIQKARQKALNECKEMLLFYWHEVTGKRTWVFLCQQNTQFLFFELEAIQLECRKNESVKKK